MEFNTEIETNAQFAYGFQAAKDAYEKLTWWERLLGKPFGSVNRLDSNFNRATVVYKS